MKGCFFELRLSSLDKFPLKIHNELSARDPSFTSVFIYDDEDCDLDFVKKKIPSNVELIKVKKVNHRYIKNMLSEQNIDFLIVFAQRIPDSTFVAVSNKLEIPSIMFQHGLYIPFMKREPSLFILKIKKTLRYIRYIYSSSYILKKNFFWMFFLYFKNQVIGMELKKINFPSKEINCKLVLVYGQHWVEYHKKIYSYETHNIKIIGVPDFLDIKEQIYEHSFDNSVTYIAQTLVEDGRLSPKFLDYFLENLLRSTFENNIRLKILLHPRSNLRFYEKFKDKCEFIKGKIPSTSVFIGHYSSLLAKAAFFSPKLILVNFPKHQIPDYLKMIAYKEINFDNSDLKSLLSKCLNEEIDKDLQEENINKLNYYFESSIESPYSEASDRIQDLVRKNARA